MLKFHSLLVFVEDFLVDGDTKIMSATLVCHRCGYDTSNAAESFLIWKRTNWHFRLNEVGSSVNGGARAKSMNRV